MDIKADWREQEERNIRHCLKAGVKKNDIRQYLFIALSLVLLALASMSLCHTPIASQKPAEEMKEEKWTCPKCGYSNLEGIEKCGICGTRRK